MIPEIKISNFDYTLPEDRIAKYPLPERDSSKLLIYDEEGSVSDTCFRSLPGYLPKDSLMVFNDTRVVPARLFFRRPTGALIEVFCLKPVLPVEYSQCFASVGSCRWKCIVGNFRKLKFDDVLTFEIPDASHKELESISLKARLLDRASKTGTIEFQWSGDIPFSRVLELCGQVPIPPYLNRKTEAVDIERYQTLYAHVRGSVAAPTAGLHFTEEVLKEIRGKNIDIENVCLHVGAGTFLPVKTENVSEHPMHMENIIVSLPFLKKLRDNRKKVIAVGTTSVRTLESLYYIGVRCIEEGKPSNVDQWEPYSRDYDYSLEESLDAIVSYLESNDLENLIVDTRIIIVPGFRFRVVDCLVTNFHQPQSTLLLLISAFVNGDWRKIYDYALGNDFRFLSYGDSSLLFRR